MLKSMMASGGGGGGGGGRAGDAVRCRESVLAEWKSRDAV